MIQQILLNLMLFLIIGLIFHPGNGEHYTHENEFNMEQHNKGDLYIGGLFPVHSIGWDASGVIPAVEMALEDINNRSDILAGYKLKLLWKDTQGKNHVGLSAYYDILRKPPTKVAILGPGFTNIATMTAENSHFYNLVQVSYSAEGARLSDRNLFPTFFRTCYNPSSFSSQLVTILLHFNWTEVGLLYANSDDFSHSVNSLKKSFSQAGIKIAIAEDFAAGSSMEREVTRIKESKVNIIIGLFHVEDSWKVFCQAFKLAIYGYDYAWIIPSWLSKEFWIKSNNIQGVNCTYDQILQASQYSLAIDHSKSNVLNRSTVSGMTPLMFRRRYQERLQTNNYTYRINPYAGFGYDAVWAVALALDNSIQELKMYNKTLTDFSYNDSEMGGIILHQMGLIEFEGVTNYIKFDKFGNVQPRKTYLKQLQGGELQIVGIILANSNRISYQSPQVSPLIWPDDHTPVAKYRFVLINIGISPIQFYFMTVLAVTGILLSTTLIMCNFKFRQERNVKMSSPKLNYLVLLGCIILYIAVIVMGIDGKDWITKLCMLTPWFICVGFTLAAGALFTKTYRVYRLLTAKTKLRAPIRDHHLYAIIFILLVIEAGILTAWTVVDPLHSEIAYKVLDIPIAERGTRYCGYYFQCNCKYKTYWFVTTISLNAVILLFGAFLAYETRNIKITSMNDSKEIAICIYNIILLCGVAIAVYITTPKHSGITYGISGGLILYCTTSSLCILFVPKIVRNCKLIKRRRPSCSTEASCNTSVMLSYDTFQEKENEIRKLKQEVDRLQSTLQVLNCTDTKKYDRSDPSE
ncbi:Gamma-aminobutyric acid type B receptor subunit 2 [Trichoplax sp. H2]|nr:Gamma-aminobutyric acid type B receptor subunit 2 [Trichoplax sp. H2]|eukprot:RDD36457.1 Gamma-aminobutyric acid type B receptor subunit 2 [Trichoplax sp. H2]